MLVHSVDLLPPRMKTAVEFMEAFFLDMGIDLGRRDVGVAQKFLNDAEVGAVFEKVGGVRVPHEVGEDALIDASGSCPLADDLPDAFPCERLASSVEKDGVAGSFSGKFAPCLGNVGVESFGGFGADGNVARFFSLARDSEELFFPIVIFEFERDEFADTQPASVEEFQDGSVTAT